MRKVAKPLLALALFAAFGLIVWKVLLPLLKDSGSPATPPPAIGAEAGLSPKERSDLASASDLEAPSLLRVALARHAGRPAAEELRRLRAKRAELAADRLETHVEGLLIDNAYAAARERVLVYARIWANTGAGERMRALDDAIDAHQQAQIDERVTEAEQLLLANRFDAAREALVTGLVFEDAYRAQLDEAAARMERRIRVRQHNLARQARGDGTETTPSPTAPAKGEPGPPPPLPGLPHSDVRRLQEARSLTAKARKLFRESRYEPADKALRDLLGYYPDLPYVKRNRDAIMAVGALSRYRTQGLGGLLNATKATRKGKRIRLLYTFVGEAEALDWEALSNIPHKEPGEFVVERGGVRGSGVMTYLHLAFFRNDVSIRCKAVIRRPQTHGLSFCQQGIETRQIMLLATNRWFVEGENYVLERPGHSLLMIGKGTNDDVPIDSPEIGFIFKGSTRNTPQPPPGAEIELSFGLEGKRMSGVVRYKSEEAKLSQEAVGDDGRSIARVRPSLFVVNNSVLFKEVEIEGVLHPEWERQRVNDLLKIAETLE